jgi:uncharacterized membrane protein YhaH (DUF805 family)
LHERFGALRTPARRTIFIKFFGGQVMGFGEAVATCFRKYAVFEGRATRHEYWYFVLFLILLIGGATVASAWLTYLLAGSNDAFWGNAFVAFALMFLLTLIPHLAAAVRRLHDSDMTGWFVIIYLIPYIGIFLWIFLLRPGTRGANIYGADPRSGPQDATARNR